MKFSLAVALLINSSSAIKLYKDNKPNAFASPHQTYISLSQSTKKQALSEVQEKLQSSLQHIDQANKTTNLVQIKKEMEAAHEDLELSLDASHQADDFEEEKESQDAAPAAKVPVGVAGIKQNFKLVKDTIEVPNLEKSVNEVSSQLPVLGALEKKLSMMKAINPELKQLSNDLQEVADWDDMKLAKMGGRAIHTILDHAYPTGGYHDFGQDFNDFGNPSTIGGIVTNPAAPLLQSSGVTGLLKAARPSQKIPWSAVSAKLDGQFDKIDKASATKAATPEAKPAAKK